MKRHYHESAKRSVTNLPVINSMLKKRFAEDQFYKMHKLRILSFERGEPRPPVPDHDFLCLYRGGAKRDLATQLTSVPPRHWMTLLQPDQELSCQVTYDHRLLFYKIICMIKHQFLHPLSSVTSECHKTQWKLCNRRAAVYVRMIKVIF